MAGTRTRSEQGWVGALSSTWREVRFALRTTLRWRRGMPRLPQQAKDDIAAGAPARGALLYGYLPAPARARAVAREAELCARYDLAALRARSTCLVYRDNVALLEVLERLLAGVELDLGARVVAVDVGAQDWRYVFALARFLACWQAPAPRAVDLTGVEIDGHVVYPDLRARCDVARAYARQTGNSDVRYVVDDFRTAPLPPCDVATAFFPFLVPYALRRWGLPDRLFDPRALLARACALLRPGGVLLSLHQTAAEAEVARALLLHHGMRVRRSCTAATDLVHDAERTRERVALCAVRAGCDPR